jgi:hypothetical protein
VNTNSPNVAGLLVTHLTTHLSGDVNAYGKVPDQRPERFTHVREIGGVCRTHRVIWRQLVIIEAWAQTQDAARELAGENDTILHDMADLGLIHKVVTAGAPAYLPDPKSGQERYTATYEIFARAK